MPDPARIGRYEVLSVLGQASQGALYKAMDQTGRVVAIRTYALDPAGEKRAEFAARFYREANDARLSHAHIVAIREVGEADGVAYIAMDYPEGEPLRALLDSGATLPIRRVVEIAADVANALDHAHENRVMHGDIKPENIVIAPGGEARIMNFGIAQIPVWPPQAGLAPTGYLAPEQVAGGNIDARADIFALGVVVYEMLTGVTPFHANDPGTIADNILKDRPIPPSIRNRRVPAVFDRIVDRALAKRPRDRYQSGLAFVRDLQDAGGGALSNGMAAAVSAIAAPDGLAGIPPSASHAGHNDSPSQRPLPGLKLLLLAIPILAVAIWMIYLQTLQPATAERAAAPSRPVLALPEPAAAISPPDLTPPVNPDLPSVSLDPVTTTETSSPPSPVPAPTVKAILILAISPWGEVYVDGKSVGVSPPLTMLQLEPGKHQVEIRNPALEPYRRTVNLESGKPLKIKHKFR